MPEQRGDGNERDERKEQRVLSRAEHCAAVDAYWAASTCGPAAAAWRRSTAAPPRRRGCGPGAPSSASRKPGHQVDLAVPAPARIGVDLEQLDLAAGVGAEIEARVIAAAEALEQARRVLDHLLLLDLGEVRLLVAHLRPVVAFGLPLRFVAEDLGQLGIEPREVDLEHGQRAQALVRIADERHRVFGAGQIFLHQDRPLGERHPQLVEVIEQRLLVLDDGILGDALRAVAVVGLEDRREHAAAASRPGRPGARASRAAPARRASWRRRARDPCRSRRRARGGRRPCRGSPAPPAWPGRAAP